MKKYFLFFFLLSLFQSLSAQESIIASGEGQNSIFDLMHYQEVLEVDLTLDMGALLADRKSKESFPAQWSFRDQEGQLQDWATKVKIRGKFRRLKCSAMPPLKLNFKKGALAEAGLAKYDDLKLVMPCVDDPKEAKELLLKEYLAYRIYNQLTDESYRVQFLRINFKDQQTGEIQQKWGFLIEDTAELRARLGAEKCEKKFGITPEQVNPEQFKTMALFQYMIGNTDWSLFHVVRNVKPLQMGEQLISIPYDFDFAGLVNAPYAIINPNYALTSLRERIYLGELKDLKTLGSTITHFKQKEKAILRLIKGCKELPRASRNDLILYIRSFYQSLPQIQLPITISTLDQGSKTKRNVNSEK